MSFFGGASNVTSAPSDMQARKEEMKQRISQELAVANAQTLINCFKKCITRPSTSLGSSEEACLSRCLNLYMAAFDQVSKSYVNRITRERAAMGAAGPAAGGLDATLL
ncbi:protein translocase subunit [Naganishia adeliensis]|uniref:Protein translocase subunit n=1 Tax=Naganishia adeliensis TaxID=92952 RepID=A0ACC2VV82_9TREE|nr:protein translocase subunit [Naganishia adeliensis]